MTGRKNCQYEEDSACFKTEILEVMFPKCSLPNVWYDLDILTSATAVHYRAPELLPLPFYKQNCRKDLSRNETSCAIVLGTHELLPLHIVALGRDSWVAKKGGSCKKFLLKMAIFYCFQQFPCSKPICTFCSVKHLILAFKCERI